MDDAVFWVVDHGAEAATEAGGEGVTLAVVALALREKEASE